MIELQHITKEFNKGQVNEIVALNDLSLTVGEKEFLVVLGANGSGKTTLLNIIAGAEYPGQGTVLISGNNVTRLPEYKRSRWVARLFQNPLSGTASELSIIDNFRLAAIRTQPKMMKIGVNEVFKKTVRERIAELGMGLENKLDQPIGTLSGGQRQALTLLMSVMDNTRILLLDEPTAALDPRSSMLVLQIADRLIKQYQLTAILITHNLKEAHQYGTRLVQMYEGRILRDVSRVGGGKALELQEIYGWFS
jgi:putative tryptophan/tyrosine transport system ATP-binding protein